MIIETTFPTFAKAVLGSWVAVLTGFLLASRSPLFSDTESSILVNVFIRSRCCLKQIENWVNYIGWKTTNVHENITSWESKQHAHIHIHRNHTLTHQHTHTHTYTHTNAHLLTHTHLHTHQNCKVYSADLGGIASTRWTIEDMGSSSLSFFSGSW